MKIAKAALSEAMPVALEYGWLLASLGAAQAASATARAHADALRMAEPMADPRALLVTTFDAGRPSHAGSFNPVIARRMANAQ